MPIYVTENGNGTVNLSSPLDSDIEFLDGDVGLVQVEGVNVALLSEDLVGISSVTSEGGAALVWDKLGDRIYQSGLDKGVLYLPNGDAVPWNGLTAIVEGFDKKASPVYYDGKKINDLVVLGDFSATMKAVTYPEEFEEMEGVYSMRQGVLVSDQPPQSFALCYRTQIGNDLDGDSVGYKIHILYNLIAIPKDKTYATVSSDPALVEFEWDLTAVPEEVPGLRPTAHLTINTMDIDPILLGELESILYGSSYSMASLISMQELVAMLAQWARIKIIDNGDGTWTATTEYEFIFMLTSDIFKIIQANAVYLDDETFIISDTTDISDIPQLKIINNGDGTWTAETEHDTLIVISPDGVFEIRNADAIFITADLYQISNTVED